MKKLFFCFTCLLLSLSIAAQTQFAKQLLDLTNYAKDGFKPIQGEKNESESESGGIVSNLTVYNTDYKLPGAIKSRIRENNHVIPELSSICYAAIYLEKGDEAAAITMFDELSERLKKELGDGFTYKIQISGDENSDKSLEIRSNEDKRSLITLTCIESESGISGKKDVYITVQWLSR